jgi:sister chromatid cohesion protein DCC1
VSNANQSLIVNIQGHYLLYPAPPTQPSDNNPAMIQHFDASDLPLDPSIRLQHLFQKREQWTLEDLSPFLDEIAIDKKKRDSILLKYARSTTVKVAIPETKADRKARIKKGVLQGPTRNVQMYSARLRSN